MTSFFSQTNPAIQRAHSRLAHDITVHQYDWDVTSGANAYADGDWTESTTTVQGTLRSPSEPSESIDASGSDVDVDAVVYVPADSIDVSLGMDDETRATELTDTETGFTYKAVNYTDQGALLAIHTTRL